MGCLPSMGAVSGSYFDSLIFRICHQLSSDARCNITLSQPSCYRSGGRAQGIAKLDIKVQQHMSGYFSVPCKNCLSLTIKLSSTLTSDSVRKPLIDFEHPQPQWIWRLHLCFRQASLPGEVTVAAGEQAHLQFVHRLGRQHLHHPPVVVTRTIQQART
jgi:hypothetical protein